MRLVLLAHSRPMAILVALIALAVGAIFLLVSFAEKARLEVADINKAVIGGVIFATIATLTALPVLYALLLRGATTVNPSLNPLDPRSRFYEAA